MEVEACLDKLPDCRLFRVQALFLTGLVDVEVEDFLFDDLGILAFERVALVEDEVDAATQGPNVNLLAEAALLQDQFGGRVVHMAAKVAPSQQLLEVVGETNGVELDDTASELLNPARVHVPVDVVLRVKVLQGNHDLVQDGESLIGCEGLFAEGLPLGDRIRGLHLDEKQVVGHNPVLFDWDEVFVLKRGEGLDHLDCAAPLLLIQGRYVDARHHLVQPCLLVMDQKDLTIALSKVEGDDQVGVVLRVGGTSRATP